MSVIFQALRKMEAQPAGPAARQPADSRRRWPLGVAAVVAAVMLAAAGLAGLWLLADAGHGQAAPRAAAVAVAVEKNDSPTKVAVFYRPASGEGHAGKGADAETGDHSMGGKVPEPGTQAGAPLPMSSAASVEPGEAASTPPAGAQLAVATDTPSVRPLDQARGKGRGGQAGVPAGRRKRAKVSGPRSAQRAAVVQRALADHSRRRQAVARLVGRLHKAMDAGDDRQVDRLMAQLVGQLGAGHPLVAKLNAFWQIRRGRYEQAEPLLRRVLAADPADRNAAVNLAVVAQRTGRLDEAYRILEALCRQYPQDEQLADWLAQLEAIR